MIDLRMLVLVAGLGLAHIVPTQEPVTPPEAPAKATQKTTQQWIADLGADSYRTRLDAEKALRGLGQKVLEELKQAAESSDDQEVQWRARRLVRQIERGEDLGLQRRRDAGNPDDRARVSPQGWGRLRGQDLPLVQDRFEELFSRMEQELGLDIPRGRFFQDDFFRDLEAQMEAGSGRSQGMSLQVGPDGKVHVEVKVTNEQGEVETKVYEAENLEEFQAQYPHVLRQNGLGMGLQLFRQPFEPFGRGFTMPGLDLHKRLGQSTPAPNDPGIEAPLDAAAEAPPADRRLGILIHPGIPAELREHLDLAAGVGLMVESVQPGTLAESLGLQRGDIVTKIGDRTIGSAKDVQDALLGIEGGSKVEVHFLRKGAEKTATATKLEGASAPAETPPADRLERRKAKSPSIR